MLDRCIGAAFSAAQNTFQRLREVGARKRFPFRGMPGWAQAIGSVLPLTYFNRLTRGILLKGNGWHELWPSIWPLLIFTALAMTVAVKFYRKTLD